MVGYAKGIGPNECERFEEAVRTSLAACGFDWFKEAFLAGGGVGIEESSAGKDSEAHVRDVGHCVGWGESRIVVVDVSVCGSVSDGRNCQ